MKNRIYIERIKGVKFRCLSFLALFSLMSFYACTPDTPTESIPSWPLEDPELSGVFPSQDLGISNTYECEIGELSTHCPEMCSLEENRCIDECPEGFQCNASCFFCEPINDTQCILRSSGMCLDACPVGQQCNEDCTECQTQMSMSTPCSYDESTQQCTDQCPENQECDARCLECKDQDQPSQPCSLEGNRQESQCLSDCPEGQVCDEMCQSCITPPPPPLPSCRTSEEGLCIDRCDEGFACDAQCETCRPTPPSTPCQLTDEGRCIDRCGEGQVCDSRCGQCIDQDRCRQDEECGEFEVCDNNICVPDLSFTCDQPTLIEALPYRNRGRLRARRSGQSRGSCGGQGHEHVYAIRLPLDPNQTNSNARPICIERTPSLESAVLYLRQACEDEGTEGICRNYSRDATQPSIELSVIPNQTYFLFIDSAEEQELLYSLSINQGACPTEPPDPNEGSCSRQAGVCISDCPPDYRCDVECGQCVPNSLGNTCITEGLSCVNQCSNGRVCDTECSQCVDTMSQPRSCQWIEPLLNGCPNPVHPQVEYQCRQANCCREVPSCPRGLEPFMDECGCGCFEPIRFCEDRCPQGTQCDESCQGCR